MAALNLFDNALDLGNIRQTLRRLEDTIIFNLIERAQYAHSSAIYRPAAIPFGPLHTDMSFLRWMLRECESWHAKVRRYESPDEYAFTTTSLIGEPLLPPLEYPDLLHPNDVNVNEAIYEFYTTEIVTALTAKQDFEDPGNYGSAATRDVDVLQAISRRIHYGKFVSESKFRTAPHLFVPHIINPNPEALDALITKPAVEEALLKRLAKKAAFYGSDLDEKGEPVHVSEAQSKIEPLEVVRMYKLHVIPLTKKVEVEYLLQRLNGLSQTEIDELAKVPSS